MVKKTASLNDPSGKLGSSLSWDEIHLPKSHFLWFFSLHNSNLSQKLTSLNTQVAYQISEARKMNVERKLKKSERPKISN